MISEVNTYQHLNKLWNVVVKRRWAVIITVVAVMTVALFWSLLATPLYRSTATIQIERRGPDILNFRDISRMDYSMTAYMDFYETQHQILRSDEIARRASKRLGLSSATEGTAAEPSLLDRLAKVRNLIPRKGSTQPPSREDMGLAQVKAGLSITPSRTSQLVEIAYSAPDPEMAARVANAVTDAYIEYNMESSTNTSAGASEFLIDQIETLKLETHRMEEELQDYGEAKNIVSMDDNSNITLRALSDIAAQQTAAKARLAEKKAFLSATKDTPPAALPQIQESELILHLKQQTSTLEGEINRMQGRFKEGWPELQAMQSKYDLLKTRLGEEIDAIAATTLEAAEAEHLKASKEVENLDALLLKAEENAQNLRRDTIDYGSLLAEVEKKRETLRSLLARQDEMQISSSLSDPKIKLTNVRIVERARAAGVPYKPNTKKNLAYALIGGLLLGLGLTFLLDFLDNTVDSTRDLEELIRLPVLASIPRVSSQERSILPVSRKKAGSYPGGSQVELITHRDAMSPVAEAYRDLRTAILLSGAGKPPRSITITSAMPGEGKSSTILNLGIVLAQLGKRVVVVDSDLRRPRLHLALDQPNEAGASTYLSGMETDVKLLIQPTVVENLEFLPSGPIPPNPSELLDGPVFTRLLQALKAAGYDHILLDAPPVLAVADPMILASIADCSLLVVRAGSTPKQAIRHSTDKFRKSDIRLVGAVLNDTETSLPDYRNYPRKYSELSSHSSGGA